MGKFRLVTVFILGGSGGPLVCMVENIPVLYGVVSSGMKCADADYPGIYAKVSGVVTWIEETVTGKKSDASVGDDESSLLNSAIDGIETIFDEFGEAVDEIQDYFSNAQNFYICPVFIIFQKLL